MSYASNASTASSRWWRWPLLPLAAFGGAFLASIAVISIHWFSMKLHGGFNEDGWYFLYVLPVMSSGAFGYAYTYISYSVAPYGKKVAGVVMVTILGLTSVASTALGWITPSYSLGDSIQTTIGAVVAIGAAILTLVDLSKDL